VNFTLVKGKDFSEHFDFKNADGKSIALPTGEFRIVLERGEFVREYFAPNRGLSRLRNRVNWFIPGEESESFEFTTMYYTLFLDEREITRGLLRIQ
jgi:hypothetical protein